MKKALLTLLTLTSINSFAGTSQIKIECETLNKGTQVSVSIPGDGASASFVITKGAQSNVYINKVSETEAKLNGINLNTEYRNGYKVATIASVVDFRQKVLTVTAIKNDAQLASLYAKASTMIVKRPANGQVYGSFLGTLKISEKSQRVSCSYKY